MGLKMGITQNGISAEKKAGIWLKSKGINNIQQKDLERREVDENIRRKKLLDIP